MNQAQEAGAIPGSRTAVVTGITGQDGAYLAQFLLERAGKEELVLDDQYPRASHASAASGSTGRK